LQKKTYRRRIFFAVIFSLFLPLHKTEAAVWPAIDPIIRTGMDYIKGKISNVLLGIVKQKAFSMLNGKINGLVGGSSSQNAKFIVDWKDYLQSAPAKKATVYVKDALSKTTAGKGSLSNYIPAGGTGTSGVRQLAQAANSIIEKKEPQVTYQGNLSNESSKNYLKAMSEMYKPGSVNNSFGMSSMIENKLADATQKEEKEAEIKAAANQGFKGTENKDGKTLLPGSLVAMNTANVQNIGNQILANARDIPETIVTALLSKTINETMERGIGKVESNVNKEITNVKANVSDQINKAIKEKGPAALYQAQQNKR